MGRQVHDAATIDSMKTTDWIALVKKTFKFTGVEEVELDKMLGESYANFSDMTSTYFGAEGKVDATGKKFEMGRDWEFSSPEAAVNYRKIMGGKTLMDNIVSDLQRDGREVAAARMFGPNYQQGFDDFMQAAKKYAKKQGPKELKKFKAEEGAMQRYYESDVKGSRYFGDGVVANVSRKMRQFADMKLLSNSLVTTLTDLSLSAGVLSSTTGKNYWTTLARVIKHQFSLFTSPAKRRDAAALMQVMMEDTMFDTTAGRTEIIGVGNSIMDRLHKNYMKIGGLPAQSASARLGNAEIMSLDLAQSSHLSFDQLYSGTRERFNNFGITSKDWEVMRNSVIELPDGSRRIVGSELKGLEGRKLRSLQTKYASFTGEIANTGSPTPGVKQHAIKSTLDPNSAAGVFMNFAMQYKSFALSMPKTMRAIAKTGAAERGDVGLKAYNYADMAQTIVASMSFGVAALAAKDVLAGREVRDFDSPESLVEVFAQSGLGLIYMDIIGRDTSKSYIDMASGIMGPAWGAPADLLELGWRVGGIAKKGKTGALEKATGELLKTMERNSPGIPFTKSVINRNVYDILHSKLNTPTKRKPNQINEALGIDFGLE